MNFLMICTDQLRADCVGYAKKYPVLTPNLDMLASESVRFSEAYCALPTCCPARQSMVCGKRPEKIGAFWNYDITLPIGSISVDEYSWARSFQESGYRTCYIGKWHVSPTLTPRDFGYDEYISEWDIVQEIRKNYPEYTWKCDWRGEISPLPTEKSVTHLQVFKALEFLERNQSKDFHLRVDFADPHLPCRPSKEFAQMYSASEIPQWDGFAETFENKPYIQRQMVRNWDNQDKTWADFSETVALYYAMITQVDDAIGILLRKLKELGLYENTVIVFTSDHGDMCGSHRMTDKHYVLYDDVVRVPLLVHIPGQAGKDCADYVINSLDLAPTLCDLFGFSACADFDGISLKSAIEGKDNDKRDCVVSTFNGQQFGLYTLRMIKQGNLKYIWNLVDTDELYDLEKDPGELVNRITDPKYGESLAIMRKKLYAELKRMKDPVLRGEWLAPQLLKGSKI